jgi:hypothetical protein
MYLTNTFNSKISFILWILNETEVGSLASRVGGVAAVGAILITSNVDQHVDMRQVTFRH